MVIMVSLFLPYMDLSSMPIMIFEFMLISFASVVVALVLLKRAKWAVSTSTYTQSFIAALIKGFLIAGWVQMMLFWIPQFVSLPTLLQDRSIIVMLGVMVGEVATWTMIKLQPKEMVL